MIILSKMYGVEIMKFQIYWSFEGLWMCKKTSCTQNSSLGFKYKYVVTHKLNSYAILHLLFALQRIIASCFKMKMDNNSPHMRPKSISKVPLLFIEGYLYASGIYLTLIFHIIVWIFEVLRITTCNVIDTKCEILSAFFW